MPEELLSGVFVPVLTPFRDDLSIDRQAHLRFCKWLLANNAGLAVFGTNSEANSLSIGERVDLLEFLVSSGIPGSRLMPGNGTCAFPDTVTLTRAALDSGSAAVLMLPPFYYKNVSEEGLFASYSEVIERVGDSGLRICLYHIPKFTGVPITLSLIGRLLARYPKTITAIKDSSGDIDNTLGILREYPQLRVFCGSERFLLDTMRNGGAGCISAGANVNPAAIDRLCQQWTSPEAGALQEGLEENRGIYETVPMIAALKAVVAAHGNYAGFATVRPPLVALGEAASDGLMRTLSATGFTMPDIARYLAGEA